MHFHPPPILNVATDMLNMFVAEALVRPKAQTFSTQQPPALSSVFWQCDFISLFRSVHAFPLDQVLA